MCSKEEAEARLFHGPFLIAGIWIVCANSSPLQSGGSSTIPLVSVAKRLQRERKGFSGDPGLRTSAQLQLLPLAYECIELIVSPSLFSQLPASSLSSMPVIPVSTRFRSCSAYGDLLTQRPMECIVPFVKGAFPRHIPPSSVLCESYRTRHPRHCQNAELRCRLVTCIRPGHPIVTSCYWALFQLCTRSRLAISPLWTQR